MNKSRLQQKRMRSRPGKGLRLLDYIDYNGQLVSLSKNGKFHFLFYIRLILLTAIDHHISKYP